MYEYLATVERVIDGDTIKFLVDLGFKIYRTETVRLRDFDAPETWRPKSEDERAHGLVCKNRVIQLLGDAASVLLRTHKDKTGKYGRMLASVSIEGVDLVETLIAEGLSKRDDYTPDKDI
jgi:endonuclease YncB( thermonuclease family)